MHVHLNICEYMQFFGLWYLLPAVNTGNVPNEVNQSVQEVYHGHHRENPWSSTSAGAYLFTKPLWAEFLSKLWFSLVAWLNRKLEVRLIEFIKCKFMYMKNKESGTWFNGHRCWQPGQKYTGWNLALWDTYLRTDGITLRDNPEPTETNIINLRVKPDWLEMRCTH